MTNVAHLYIGRWWKKVSSEKIQCFLCPRECVLADRQRGFCFIRQNIGGQLILTAYGQTSGLCVDPIEKKPLNHFYPGSSVLSFATIGCNLACRFCQNWRLSKVRDVSRLAQPATPQAIAQAAQQNACASVAFTYNEPVISAEYAIDVAEACHAAGIKTVAVTAGYIQGNAREEFFRHIDAANVDLKAFSPEFYQKFCAGDLSPVLDTIAYIKQKTNVWLEITNLIIPGENDSDEIIADMCRWIIQSLGPDVPLHLTAFHPDGQMAHYPATPLKTLTRARQIAQGMGIRFCYTGNVADTEGENTFCHHCKKIVVERNGYVIRKNHLDYGQCRFCKTVCPGCFD